MGVQGLWSILDPTSKPIRIETLRGKRMAIDASIWLYQFMKAMRDMTGETIYGSHLVGFVRRICKLLFHGIKPIFVFDGGVPELKSATIRNRRERKQKAQVSVEKVAEKVLKAQMTVIGLENVQNSFSAAQNVGLVNATTIPDEYELPTEK
jgi:DNA excision repair protein ERCC-5